MAVYFNEDKNVYYYKGKFRNKFTGKREDYYKSNFKTEKAAKRAEAKFIEMAESTDATMTFELLQELYLKETKKTNKESTLYTDRTCLNNHIGPCFNSFKIINIKSTDIMEWQSGLVKQGYSARYINKNQEVLSKILKFAVTHYNLPGNEAIKVKKLKEEKKKVETLYWEADTVFEFLSAIDDEEWELFFKLLFLTGMRIGEFVSLRICDWKKTYFDVTRTLTYKTDGKGYAFTKPKSARSIRRVYMDEQSIQEINNHIANKVNVYGLTNEYFIFGNNRPFSTTHISRKMDEFINSLNNKRAKNNKHPKHRITPHGLRHSLASYLISENENDTTIADRLGHTVDELRDTYAHVYKEKKIELTSAISKLHSLSVKAVTTNFLQSAENE